MTNYWGLQIGESSLTCCVPVLLRVSRRVKQEYIFLDVVKWVVSQSINKRGLFYNLWFISRYNFKLDFMFLGNESELCECRANVFFWIRLRQPVWSYTLITIIRMISWAGTSVHKIFIFLLPCFVIIAFCLFLTLRSIL